MFFCVNKQAVYYFILITNQITMATKQAKLIDQTQEQVNKTRRDNWKVMKPFVHFSFLALKVVGFALMSIVMSLPLLKPRAHRPPEIKNSRTTRKSGD